MPFALLFSLLSPWLGWPAAVVGKVRVGCNFKIVTWRHHEYQQWELSVRCEAEVEHEFELDYHYVILDLMAPG